MVRSQNAAIKNEINKLRELFIKRMTVDSETQDRRRKNYNQAIFHYNTQEDIDRAKEWREKYNVDIRMDETYPVWDQITMDMVLQCFDNAVKDYIKMQKEDAK